MITFGSVCSGIEAASVAWHPLGWRAAWLAEIERFPAAVLAHHYPDVPNLGDMTKLAAMIRAGDIQAPDVFCGGTPCQAFSVAGLRRSLDDHRGNLSLTFCEIANAIDDRRDIPATIFWENVPGVLSTKDNAFGCFLAGLAGEDDPLQPPGGRWANAGAVYGPRRAVAWRVLDAQYFGVAQRRRRVFVVASARKGFDPAAVLFEFDGMRRDTAPRREAGEAATSSAARSVALRGREGGATAELGDDLAGCLRASNGGGDKPHALAPVAHVDTMPTMTAGGPSVTSHNQTSGQMRDQYIVPMTAHTLRGEGFDASEDGTGRGTPLVPIAFQAGNLVRGAGSQPSSDVFPTLKADHGRGLSDQHPCVAVAFQDRFRGDDGRGYDRPPPMSVEQTGTLETVKPWNVVTAMQVRRLTPEECEALQGFQRGYTAIPWRGKPAEQCPDGPRYRALGNSWAIPVVRWIGARIQEALVGERHRLEVN